MNTILQLGLALTICAATPLWSEPARNAATETRSGIAGKYPMDQGIAADPQVIFADGFERHKNLGDLAAFWNGGVYDRVRLSHEAETVFGGHQALEFTVPQQAEAMANTVARILSPEEDVVFLRYYEKIDPGFDVLNSSHDGGVISAHYYIHGQATPGVKADGYNKFLVSYEDWRDKVQEPNPGSLNVYVYYPDQRSQWGDHFFPAGTVLPFSYRAGNFGPEFQAHPDRTLELGRWYCKELMVKANTPGQSDGRVICWVDGELAADFPHMRFRETADLKMDRIDLSMYIGQNTAHEAKIWYDDVVVARAYVGPMRREVKASSKQ